MIVILAVALIVVGPDKLPDLARSVAKGVLEMKKTLNQVKDSLADEDNLIGSVKSDLHKASHDLKTNLIESDHFTFHDPPNGINKDSALEDEVIDSKVRPWEEGPDAKQEGEGVVVAEDPYSVPEEEPPVDKDSSTGDTDTSKA